MLIPRLSVLQCPEDPSTKTFDAASFLINKGLAPAVGSCRAFLFAVVRPRDVTDGLSTTAFVSERIANTQQPDYYFPVKSPPVRRLRREMDEIVVRFLSTQSGMSARHHGNDGGRVLSIAGGYNHLLPPNQANAVLLPLPVDFKPPFSVHGQGVNVLYADGSVSLVSEQIDRQVWWDQGTISGEAGRSSDGS